MDFNEICEGQRYWVLLGEDDVYGADDPSDILEEVVVLEKNDVHLDVQVRQFGGEDEWTLDPEQFYPSKELAVAALNEPADGPHRGVDFGYDPI